MEQFISFVNELSADAKDNPDEWENTTIADYLEQMASWIEDAYVIYDDIDWEKIDYKTFAKILYMGKIYE